VGDRHVDRIDALGQAAITQHEVEHAGTVRRFLLRRKSPGATVAGRRGRRIMPSFTRRLRQETPGWVRHRGLTAQQAEAVLARYPESGHWFQRPIAIFSILGGALVVLAIALVIAHNWQQIPRWAKLAGVLTSLISAYTGGLVIRARGHGLVGEGLFVLGGGLFLLGIALIGQLYNLAGRESDAVLLWWALLMPAAYALPSIALVVLAWCGASVWFCM